jgi:DNA polymerase III sliding clamp (beta) subunit (PCNA family)
MKFSARVEQFVDGLFPAYNMATKCPNKDYDDAGKITLNVSENKVIATSHAGTAAITALISNNIAGLDYKCMLDGSVTIKADDFDKALQSFRSSDIIIVDSSTSSLSISNTTDKKSDKQVQTILLESEDVVVPSTPDSFSKSISINREIFVDGVGKVAFAMGYAVTQEHYMCQFLRVEPDRVRFASGTGARFAVRDVEGSSITQTSEIETFVLPRYNIPNIVDIFGNSSSKDVTVCQSKATDNNAAQIVIGDGKGISLTLLSVDESIVYPKLDSILEYDYPFEISSKWENWKYVIAGVEATNSNEARQNNGVHNTNVTACQEDNCFLVETKTELTSERRVEFEKINKIDGELFDPSFRCNSAYLHEVINNGTRKGNVTFAFEGISKSNPEGASRPVVARFDDDVNDVKNTTEKFSLFFATSKL